MRNHKVTVRLDDKEFALLKTKVRKAGLSQEGYLRVLIKGYVPREKPDDRFYVVMRQLAGLSNNCHQLLKKANALGFIDTPMLKGEAEKWAAFRKEMQRRYLYPEKAGEQLGPPQSCKLCGEKEQPRSVEPLASQGESDKRRVL